MERIFVVKDGFIVRIKKNGWVINVCLFDEYFENLIDIMFYFIVGMCWKKGWWELLCDRK